MPPHAAAPSHELQVDLLRFERRGTDRVELWARWTLRADTKLVHTGESRIQVPISGAGDGVAAAALSGAIGRLAIEIAEQVQIADVVSERNPSRSKLRGDE